MEQCRGLSDCNSCAPNALKRLNLKLHQNGFNFIFWDLTHKWYEKNWECLNYILCPISLSLSLSWIFSGEAQFWQDRALRVSEKWVRLKKVGAPYCILHLLGQGPIFCILLANNCTILLCSLDVGNIDDQCRGPSVKEKDHLAGQLSSILQHTCLLVSRCCSIRSDGSTSCKLLAHT